MAVSIMSSLFPEKMFKGIPKMPISYGAVAHMERGLLMAQLIMGMVHTPIPRHELLSHPQGKLKIMEEAEAMRSLGVWNESELWEVDELKKHAREKQKTIHVAELMVIGSIKGSELPEEQQSLKIRLVYRGDATRDQDNQVAIFREMKSLPATVTTINFVLWFGLRKGHVVRIADATKAYLQAPIRSTVPTYVILPKEIWKPHWFKRFRRVASKLEKAIYGHPTSGDDWAAYLDETIVFHPQGERVENYPSLWYFRSLDVLIAAYVDDIVASGPEKSVEVFWQELDRFVKVASITEPGRYLGRDHVVYELGHGKQVFMSMGDYAVSSYKLYEDTFNSTLKIYDTPFMSEAALTPEGYECQGNLSGSASQLLMNLLWLARLSRPDISVAITSLASSISSWTYNHDLMLYRLLGYVKGSVDLGLLGFVSYSLEIPRIHMYADADLAGDPLTCKSHSGHYIILKTSDGTFFPIMWGAKKQSRVSRSTTEAEIVSASELVFSEGIPLKHVMEELLQTTVPSVLQEDNSSVVTILRSGYSQKLRSFLKQDTSHLSCGVVRGD